MGIQIMKHVILAAAAVLAVGAVGTAHAQSAPSSVNAIRTVGTNAASLDALLAEWDRAGFVPPSKPGQYRVYGRNGYVTSGAGYNALVSLIRSAVNDSREGRNRDAVAKIAKARSLLAADRAQG
jgi:hypothetical protein